MTSTCNLLQSGHNAHKTFNRGGAAYINRSIGTRGGRRGLGAIGVNDWPPKGENHLRDTPHHTDKRRIHIVLTRVPLKRSATKKWSRSLEIEMQYDQFGNKNVHEYKCVMANTMTTKIIWCYMLINSGEKPNTTQPLSLLSASFFLNLILCARSRALWMNSLCTGQFVWSRC